MRQIHRLLGRDGRLDLCLLPRLAEVDRIVTFETFLMLASLPLRCQIVNFFDLLLGHAREHTRYFLSSTTCRILSFFSCLLFLDVNGCAAHAIQHALTIVLLVLQRVAWQKHHVGLVI